MMYDHPDEREAVREAVELLDRQEQRWKAYRPTDSELAAEDKLLRWLSAGNDNLAMWAILRRGALQPNPWFKMFKHLKAKGE